GRRAAAPARRVAAGGVELAGLQPAQEARLLAERHVRDLVEEQRAAVGELEAAGAIGARVGERALDVAEQLALEQAIGETAGVDRDECLVGAPRAGGDRPREHPPARALRA